MKIRCVSPNLHSFVVVSIDQHGVDAHEVFFLLRHYHQKFYVANIEITLKREEFWGRRNAEDSKVKRSYLDSNIDRSIVDDHTITIPGKYRGSGERGWDIDADQGNGESDGDHCPDRRGGRR